MRNVQTQRLGNDAGAFAMDAGGSYLPILYRISLQFVEIEPTYRRPTSDGFASSDTTSNRSIAGGTPPNGSSTP